MVFRKISLENDPDLSTDSGGGVGTITWVDPEDMDGDGITGDICEVLWQRTGTKGDYRTGYEGEYRLALAVHSLHTAIALIVYHHICQFLFPFFGLIPLVRTENVGLIIRGQAMCSALASIVCRPDLSLHRFISFFRHQTDPWGLLASYCVVSLVPKLSNANVGTRFNFKSGGHPCEGRDDVVRRGCGRCRYHA